MKIGIQIGPLPCWGSLQEEVGSHPHSSRAAQPKLSALCPMGLMQEYAVHLNIYLALGMVRKNNVSSQKTKLY